jgi:hypothetical protein
MRGAVATALGDPKANAVKAAIGDISSSANSALTSFGSVQRKNYTFGGVQGE